MHRKYCFKLLYPNTESEIIQSVTCNIDKPKYSITFSEAPTSVATRFLIGNDCLFPVNINVLYMGGKNIVKKNYYEMKQSDSITFIARKSIAFSLVGVVKNDVDLYTKKCEVRDPRYTSYGGYCYELVYPSEKFEITHFFSCEENPETFNLKTRDDVPENKSIIISTMRSIAFALVSANQKDVDLYSKKCYDRESDFIMDGNICSEIIYPNKELEITHFVMCDDNIETFASTTSSAVLPNNSGKITIGNNCLLPLNISVRYTNEEGITNTTYYMKKNESVNFHALKSTAFAWVCANQSDSDIYMNRCNARDPEYVMHDGCCSKMVYPDEEFGISHFVQCPVHAISPVHLDQDSILQYPSSDTALLQSTVVS